LDAQNAMFERELQQMAGEEYNSEEGMRPLDVDRPVWSQKERNKRSQRS
jgi:hypothetical protein